MRISTGEFIRNFGALSDRALTEPVTITKNGRDRLVVLSAEEYDRLRRRDRRVIRAEEITDEELNLISAAEVGREFDHLNAELDDSKS